MTQAQPSTPAAPPEVPEGLDPAASVWVSASAGSGKTTLLVRRGLRLLLEPRPDRKDGLPRILCLTYTRAAAAEMQERINKALARWAGAGDDALRDELARDYGVRPTGGMLSRARRLFGQVLEGAGTVQVMTLHSFCQTLLNRFPLEAGVPPHFTVLEGDALENFQAGLLENFLGRVMADEKLQEAFQRLSARTGPEPLRAALKGVYDAENWTPFFEKYPTPEDYAKKLREILGLEEGMDEETFLAAQCRPPALDETSLRRLARVMAAGSANERKCAAVIAPWLENESARAENFGDYAQAWLTQELAPRKNVFTKGSREKHPGLAAFFDKEMQRVYEAVQRLAALRFLRRQCDGFVLYRALFLKQEEAKSAQAVLTYDDLALRARALLQAPGLSGWVLYKLDGGFDHLLVDEAQDTAPIQWDVIFALLEEFLSGEGAREGPPRTVFVVGDEKQSIYSFQGADRGRYMSARRGLFSRLAAARRDPRRVDLNKSWRAPPAMLKFVDEVFAADAARAGVARNVTHDSARKEQPSRVELWPPVTGTKPDIPPPWFPPLKREEGHPAPVRLARQIAETLSRWLKEGWHLAAAGRAVQPGDVMILLQRRSHLLLPIVRALKDAHIPVAGVDRMVLKDQPAVQDILSLCRFLLLPEDDLALAEVLRGPFVRLDEARLFALARGREGSLWQSLREKAAGDALSGKALEWLGGLLAITDRTPPFDLLNLVLFRACPGDEKSGRHALMHRLGPDAADPVEQLLAAALAVEDEEAPALQLFVQAVTRSEHEIRREPSGPGGQVRILTVHGAKGLEAPIVILPDLARAPAKAGRDSPLFWSEALPLCLSAEDAPLKAVQQAKESRKRAREEEHRRLLYVALTRARDVLVLCGVEGPDGENGNNWHDFCRDGLERLGVTPIPAPEGSRYVYGEEEALAPQASRQDESTTCASLPDWAMRRAPESGKRGEAVNPSGLAAQKEKILPPAAREERLKRGQRLHRLLQFLPGIPEESRRGAAAHFLAAQSGKPEDAEEVLRVIAHPVFAPLFGPRARAEAPLAGRLQGRIFSGQVDRLAILENEILVADFKTNRPPPKCAEDIPLPYLAQMAAYRALLEKAFPGKRVRAALLWTFNLNLVEISGSLHARGLEFLGLTGASCAPYHDGQQNLA